MDNEYLFNLHSTLLSLQQRTEDELKSSNSLLKDDIARFKNNGQEKPTLETVNELWNPIKGKIVSNAYKNLSEIQKNSYPIFEEFIKYVVNTHMDIDKMIEIISINLKKMTLFMKGEINDFNFSNEINESSINDKMTKLVQEVNVRGKSASIINREVKINEINALIQERKKMIRSLNDDLV